jgi:hypothetical protein
MRRVWIRAVAMDPVSESMDRRSALDAVVGALSDAEVAAGDLILANLGTVISTRAGRRDAYACPP